MLPKYVCLACVSETKAVVVVRFQEMVSNLILVASHCRMTTLTMLHNLSSKKSTHLNRFERLNPDLLAVVHLRCWIVICLIYQTAAGLKPG